MMTALLLAAGSAAGAQFTYVTSVGTVTITRYTGPTDEAVDVPGTIDGLPVTSIGYAAFCFTAPSSVTLPDGILGIGDYAFTYCARLTNISLPDSLLWIGIGAFSNCPLSRIILPSSLTNLTYNAFESCPALADITVKPGNHYYSSLAGVLFNRDGTALLLCPPGKDLPSGTYVVPDSVSTIAEGAFEGCANLEEVSLGNNIITIGPRAFQSCRSLRHITVPDSVKTIADGAFVLCTNLKEVVLGNSLASIGAYALAYCSSLTSISVPDSVTNISHSAFESSGLTSFTFPGKLTTIAERMFSSTALANITIPNSVTNIQPDAFSLCKRLTNIVLPDSITAIPQVAFRYSGLTSIQFPAGLVTIGSGAFQAVPLASITLPGSLSSIGYSAFIQCSNLTHIEMPAHLTNIGHTVFYECPRLASLLFLGDNVTGLAEALHGVDPLIYYVPGTQGWNAPVEGHRTMLWNPKVQTADSAFGLRNGAFGFAITGSTNLLVTVESTTNLAAWSPVQTITLAAGAAYFQDSLPSTGSPQRFYRLRPAY